jgi:pimeloyl-ACP methyl ester carboxylesterase
MTTTYAPKQTTTRGHTVQINNIEMYYEEYGAGKPLVLLHGFGGSGQNWYPFTDKLSERHRLIVVDLRGHGHSTNPENQFTHREAANDVFLLLEKLGVGHFSAMGISSGAMTLLHMATSQPKRIDSMVLIVQLPISQIRQGLSCAELRLTSCPNKFKKCIGSAQNAVTNRSVNLSHSSTRWAKTMTI